jgi:hypothetical protein
MKRLVFSVLSKANYQEVVQQGEPDLDDPILSGIMTLAVRYRPIPGSRALLRRIPIPSPAHGRVGPSTGPASPQGLLLRPASRLARFYALVKLT